MMSNSNNTRKKISSDKLIPILSVFIIPLICILIGYIKGGLAPFGGKDIITVSKSSDEFYRYIEFFCQKGPVSESAFPILIDLIYMILIPICCLSFFLFLDNRFGSLSDASYEAIDDTTDKKSDKKNIILGGSYLPKSEFGKKILQLNPIGMVLSISFGLSMFFLSEGADISNLSAIVVFPLIILGIDKLVQKEKATLFTIFLSLSICLNPYISIISYIFCLLYIIVEVINNKDNALYAIKGFILSSLCSLLVSAFRLISICTSGKLSEQFSLHFVRPSKINNPWNAFSQLMFNSKIADLNMYNSGVNLYVGLLGLLLFLGFIVNSKINIAKRIGYTLITLSLLLGTIFSTPNYLFNGFRGYYYNAFVFGYLFSFIILIMTYECIQNINGINKLFFSMLALALATLIILTMKKAEMLDSIKPLYYSLEILFAYFLIILIYRDKSMAKVLFTILISLLSLFEVSFTYTTNLANKGNIAYTRPTIDTVGYKLNKVYDYVKKNDPGSKILNLDEIGLDTNPFRCSLEGYDYIATSKSPDTVDPLFQPVESIKEKGMVRAINIYMNPYAINSALWNSDITSYKYDNNYPFASANILSNNYSNSGDIFSVIEGNTEAIPTSDSNLISFTFSASELGEAYSRAYYTEYIGKESTITPTGVMQTKPIDRFNDYTYQYALFNHDNLKNLYNTATSDTKNIRILVDNKEYTISASTDGYLSVPIKKTANLVAIVNGKKVQTSDMSGELTLIPVSKGNNTIRLYYSNIYTIVAFIISILTLIILIASQFNSNKKDIAQK